MTSADGELIGRGRAADVYALGDDRVVRRYRTDRSCEVEYRAMRHLRGCGYPVPEVFDVDGRDLVMERLDGRTLLDELGATPWRAAPIGRTLAELHRRLAEVPVPADLELPLRFTSDTARLDGQRLVLAHLDLHPDNVMVTSAGPVVFDWSNAAIAPRGADAAMTSLLVGTSEVEASWWMRPLVGAVRGRFLRAFLRAAELPEAVVCRSIVEHRLADPNVLPVEAERLRRSMDDGSARAGRRRSGATGGRCGGS